MQGIQELGGVDGKYEDCLLGPADSCFDGDKVFIMDGVLVDTMKENHLA